MYYIIRRDDGATWGFTYGRHGISFNANRPIMWRWKRTALTVLKTLKKTVLANTGQSAEVVPMGQVK